ncbi:MAG: hypothetical protein N2C14_29780, partial [Planctomycetales bacterium]
MALICSATILLFVGSQPAAAAITSENHPRLKRVLDDHPETDADQNGLLDFDEHQAFVKSQEPRKLSNGRPAGPISTLLPNGDLLITDFEENSFGRMREWGWTVEGDSFPRDLTHATRIMRRRVGTFLGRTFLSSYPDTDATTGKIVSPPFEIELNYVRFQMSGGEHPQRMCVNLVVDGKIMRTATGNNDDWFQAVAFDVGSLRGRLATIEIIDAHTGVWGRVNVDHIVQADHADAPRVMDRVPVFGQVTGTVQTLGSRRRGSLSVNNGNLEIDRQAVETSDVLLAMCENEAGRRTSPNALRLINGEIWRGQLQGMQDGKITLQNGMLERIVAPVNRIASVDFEPAGTNNNGEPGVLYRNQGEPIPGKLVWIREKDVAIDCALGVVPVPRPTVRRFVLAAGTPRIGGLQDELGLIDGSVLHGEFAAEADRLVFKHDVLGSLDFNLSAIRYLRRAPQGVIWLDQLQGEVVTRVGPILPPPGPTVTTSMNSDFLRAIRM